MPAGLTDTIVEWESSGLPNETIRLPVTENHSFSPKIVSVNNSRIRVRFKGTCLKQDKVTFTPRNVINLFFIVYKLNRWSQDLNADFTLKVCLFVTVKLTKNADRDKYFYPGYGIVYDACSLFSFPKFDWDKMLLFLE